MMRLLVFNLATDADDPILGFATRWLWALAARVEQISVITMRAGRIAVPDNVRVFSVGKEKGYSEPRRAIYFYQHLFRILQRGNVDVCFSHMIPVFTVLAAPVLRAKGIPVVTWYAHRQVTTMLKAAHHVSVKVVASAETAYGYRRDRLVVVGQGIDTEQFTPEEVEAYVPPLLLSVGRLSPIKDIMTLIDAVALLRRRGCPCRCALVGDAPQRDRAYAQAVHERVATTQLESDIMFVGSMPNHQTTQWYRRSFAHVNLCPTGALDKAALEAMACGRPSLVANEGFRETLGPWADRLLFQHGNAENLAWKVQWLLQQGAAERGKMSSDLRRSVIERHSLDRLAERLVGIFGEASRR